MTKFRSKPLLLLLAALVFLSINWAFPLASMLTSGQINIIAGQELKLNSIFLRASLVSSEPSAIVIEEIDSKDGVTIRSDEEGTFKLASSFFGIPLRQWTVNVLPNTLLYPGGELIGVKIDSKGLIAYKYKDIGDILSPAKRANIRIGDIIQKINGREINNAKEFLEALNEEAPKGKMIRLTAIRDGQELDFMVSPVYSEENKSWLIGLYIKDDIAGIGTLTYVTSDKSKFGALGHAITEVKSGVTVPINKGELKGAQVINLVKGEKNEPGAIRGIIAKREQHFGYISSNGDYGIFGSYGGGLMDERKVPIPIGLQNEVKVGQASILTTIGEEIKEYEIRITKVNHQIYPNTKSMIIQVVDPELLAKTGGIIQGMSGSPILQNGKIVGAVTHVLVNDPKMGYGIFIEWMLQNQT